MSFRLALGSLFRASYTTIMKHLCIDYGLVRTGVAASDPDGILAYPLKTFDLSHYPNRRAFLEDLCSFILSEQPECIIVGLPLHGDGSESMTTRQVRNFTERLLHRITLPVFFYNEYLSSEIASMDLQELGLKGSRKKAVLDQQAAVRILETCLAHPEGKIPVSAKFHVQGNK